MSLCGLFAILTSYLITAKCYSKLLKHQHQHLHNTKEGREGNSSKGNPTTYKKSIDTSSKPTRRHDGLKHYPFVDEFGSVVDVLKEVKVVTDPSKPMCPAAMADPILKHTIKKVFDEFKIGSNGLKACDIPEALKVCTSSFNITHIILSSHDVLSCHVISNRASAHRS